MNGNELERYNVIKSMDTLARALNNEEFYYGHWINIVPDCATEEDYEDLASDDYTDLFSDAVRVFINHFNEYAQDGGFYIAGECIN